MLDKIEAGVSAEVVDWTREAPRRFWDPGRKLLLAIRRYQYWRGRRGPVAAIACKWLVLRHRFWSVLTGADLPLTCHIGGGLLIPHPNGIVVHPDARIGVNCLIFQQVTIGTGARRGLPEIGGHVDIGAGARILGPVRIGAHARIGANAVVLADVAAGTTAVGVPARQVG
jgi:serine O-acetyltransferase